MKKFYPILGLLLLLSFATSAQLSNITGVTLTFTPAMGSPITATATDGGSGLTPDGGITLMESTRYTLTVSLQNGATDITNEVGNNADDYQFFFTPTGSIFNGDVTTLDTDSQGFPLGLTNDLTTECTEDANASGMLQVVLADLTGIKTASSTANDGTAIFDLSWNVTIVDDPDAPPCENEEEIITDVILTWTPVGGGDAIVGRAQDPDGPGPQDLQIQGPIDLVESTEYTLTIELRNEIEGEDITEEIRQEDDEHMFFFAWADEVFVDPEGDGNVDNRDDAVNYNDFDENSLPVGLSTSWTTECGEEMTSGSFRVVLKHQPGVKSATSTVEDGGTDVDLTWTINVNEDPDAPPCENEEEVITDVILTWTPVGGGDAIVGRAQDPDGPGPQDLQIQGPIDLVESTEYTLTIELRNEIEGEDITEEIRQEDDEHMFFFAWADEVFVDPEGDGNVDNRDDAVNYNDFDENSLPVGLSTSWTTECGEEMTSGSFRVVLKHQPGVKSATSTVEDGGTDVDLTWTINVNEDPDAPPCENEEEIITDVILTWTPVGGGDAIVGRAQDPDGPGPQDLQIQGPIDLVESTEYTLTIELRNEIEGEDITEEIRQEDDEHMFFFAWADEVFVDPEGDGNVDSRDDAVNYNDFDENSLPVGLSTSWTTECGEEMTSGSFRVVLKHQPGVKSATSTVEDGGTDVDLTWTINVNEDPDAPPCENEEEVITDVILTWTPVGGGDAIVARAQDPDGPGPQDLQIQGPIDLVESTEYTLTIELRNEIEGEDITEEIRQEDDEHMFFFAWADEVFVDPEGDGNVDNRDDAVNYNDFDENSLPVGLSTSWTTECGEEMTSGSFRVVLKHQPGVKSATSTVEDGGTDVDLTWTINVNEDPDAPPCENEEEIITDVILTWTPVGGGFPTVARAQDPDGPGPQDLQILGDINLMQNTQYSLAIELRNEIEGEDITEEIRQEDDEHMFFFSWTDGIFSNPTGDGNADNRDDTVNYNDFDENGEPVGLSTSWTTATEMNPGGTFRVVLKHQPGVKSSTSTINDGGTDIDLTWNINTLVTDVDDVAERNNQLQIFPNPTKEELNWRLESTEVQDVSLYLYDQLGRLLKVYDVPNPSIDVQHLEKGTYILQARSEDKIWTQRFVKL